MCAMSASNTAVIRRSFRHPTMIKFMDRFMGRDRHGLHDVRACDMDLSHEVFEVLPLRAVPAANAISAAAVARAATTGGAKATASAAASTMGNAPPSSSATITTAKLPWYDRVCLFPMHVTPAVCNVYGTMHGGAFATVLDMATSTHMTLQLLDRQPPVIHVTSALQTRYYKAARDGDFLIGRTAMRRAGKRMIWCDMDFVPLAAMPVLRPRLVPAGNAAATAAVEDEADVRKILADATRRRDWRLTWAPVLAPESSAATSYGATALSVLGSPTDPHNAAGGLDVQSVADGDSDAALVSWPLLPVAEPLCSGTNTKAISVFDMSKFKVHAPN